MERVRHTQTFGLVEREQVVVLRREGPFVHHAALEVDGKGIDVERVTAWFEANVAGAVAPFEFDLIAGGHSNLTFGVTGADGTRFVLRRPPLGHVLATAHDMGREHRIISALQPTDVPVPPVLGLCGDDDVNGAPFYVMGFVDGHVVRGLPVDRVLELIHR